MTEVLGLLSDAAMQVSEEEIDGGTSGARDGRVLCAGCASLCVL